MNLLLIALFALEGPAAVFWSAERTWLVDVEGARVLSAPGWFARDGEGVRRYALRTVLEEDSRWTELRTAALGERSWRVLLGRSAPPGRVHDELAVLQFRGHEALLGRFQRSFPSGRATRIWSVSLPGGEALPPPEGAGEALPWLSAQRPALGDCDAAPQLARVEVEGQLHSYLSVPCGARPLMLQLDRAAESQLGPLSLSGEAVEAPGVWPRDPVALAEDCTLRELRHADRTLAVVPRATGLRWLDPEDPLRDLSGAWARAPGEACPRAIDFGAEAPAAQLCAIDELDRPWGGPEDLAVGLRLEVVDAVVRLSVDIRDQEPRPGDGLRLWFGEGRRPASFELDASGFRWKRSPKGRKTPLPARMRAVPGGYLAEIEFPIGVFRGDTALSLRVQDEDAEGRVQLWRGSRVDRRNPRAAPFAGPL